MSHMNEHINHVKLTTHALGDTIAFMPVVEKFAKSDTIIRRTVWKYYSGR
jgi:hypothetical protein